MSAPASLSTSPARAILSYLESKHGLTGQQRAGVLLAIELTEEQLESDDYRMDLGQYSKLWALAEQHSGDPAIGLHVGTLSEMNNASVVTCLVVQCDNYQKGIEDYIKYYDILNSNVRVEMDIHGESATLNFIHLTDDSYSIHEAERVTTLIYQRNEFLSRGTVKISRMYFAHPKPSYWREYAKVFDCEVQFSAPYTGFAFPSSALAHSPNVKNRYIYKSLLEHAQNIKNKLFSKRHSTRVEDILRQEPDLSRVDIVQVSKRLNMNRQTLYRKLKSEGVAFSDVLKKIKQARAKEYLRDTSKPLVDIALSLGFADSSSFSRAFKAWTGHSPKSYREKLALKNS